MDQNLYFNVLCWTITIQSILVCLGIVLIAVFQDIPMGISYVHIRIYSIYYLGLCIRLSNLGTI